MKEEKARKHRCKVADCRSSSKYISWKNGGVLVEMCASQCSKLYQKVAKLAVKSPHRFIDHLPIFFLILVVLVVLFCTCSCLIRNTFLSTYFSTHLSKDVHTRSLASVFSEALMDPWILEMRHQMLVAFSIQLITG